MYRKLAVTGAIALGLAAGSYGVASAASGSGSSNSNSGLSAAAPTQSAPTSQQPWGQQRPDETLLTGDTRSKVEAAATAKLPGATIIRTETDADGNAPYEVHMVKSDGTPATVYVGKSFDVVSVQTGMRAGPQQAQA